MSTMTDAEKKMLYSYIGASTNYLEFGSGESTVYASSVPTIKIITSVESSEQFIDEHLKNNADIVDAVTTGKLSFHIVDIGETRNWGYPKDETKKHLWPNYSLSAFRQKTDYDLFFIDGRFRVACTLNCILNSSKNSTILIHDFYGRPEYNVVLNFLNTVDKADTLGVFKKKEGIDLEKVQSLIKIYQYLPKDRTVLDKIKRESAKLFHGRS